MKMTSYDDDDVDDDEEDDDAEDPEDDAEEERTSLAEAIDSLLDVKPELTPAWAESVRQILRSTDMSSSASSSSSSDSSGSADPASHTPARWCHDQHHDKVVAGLEGELFVLKTALRVSNSHRCQILSRMLDLKGNIRVFCRVRPLLSNERNARVGHLTTTPGTDTIKVVSCRKDFQFDKVFLPSSVQDDIFLEVEPIIRSALDGHNVCIFAYGQTGTGKTFTMEGNKDQPGVVPRTLQRLFEEACFDNTVSYAFSLSMLEVYKGRLRDLLVCHSSTQCTDYPVLSIQMASDGCIDVDNLTEMPILDAKEAGNLYQQGSQSRSTSCTNANETSSRSHCLLRITITCTYVLENHKFATTSKLWLVDLGGSERLSKTNAGGITLEEGKAINVSLSALGDVISALQRKQPHVPYRNSKLTQLLRDSLGAQSKTLMLVHVSPKVKDIRETVCSLSFASRARGTHLGCEISQKRKREKAAVIAELYRLMNIHDDECQSLRASIKTIEALMEERKVLLSQTIQGNSDQPVDSKNLPVQASFFTPSSKTCPQTLVDSLKASIPRFMSPTASSRHKQRHFEQQQIVGSQSHLGYTLVKTGPLLKRARKLKNGNLKSPKTIFKPANNPRTAISQQDPEIQKKKSSWTPSMMIEEMIKEPAAALEASKLADRLSGGQDSHFEGEISIEKDVDTDRLSTSDWNKRQRPKRMEKMEKSRYLSSYPSGRMCRVQRRVAVGCRRKVTVKCSMTVTKRFLC
ncbi:unnamed protein product [Sphagnum balticum]